MRHSTKSTDEVIWSELVAEATALLAIPPESMSTEQRDRLDALSDAFIHLVGYAESEKPYAASEQDLRLLDELARRRTRVGHPRPTSRRAQQAPAPLMNDAERRSLRERIVTGLHAGRLRVRESEAQPFKRALESGRRVIRADLLHEIESAHRAVVVPELAIAAGAGCELWDVECDTTLDVPPDLPRAPYLALGVTGDSMEPLLHSGDTILVRMESQAVTGTVIVARDPDHGYIVKEVGRLTPQGIELLSLNPAFPAVRVPHMSGAVLGTVVMKWCPHAERRMAG